MNGRRNLLGVVVQRHMRRHRAAVFGQLLHQHRRKLILNAALKHLAACSDNAHAARGNGQQAQDGRIARQSLGLLHGFFFNGQRDDARAAQLIPRLDHKAGGARGNHHTAHAVDGAQARQIDQEKAVARRGQFNLALLGLRGFHVLTHAQIAQNGRRIVFVQHVFVLLPNVYMLLAYAEQHRDIFLADDVSLAEHRVLGYARNNLSDIMAKHLADGLSGFHQLHGCFSPINRSYCCCASSARR